MRKGWNSFLLELLTTVSRALPSEEGSQGLLTIYLIRLGQGQRHVHLASPSLSLHLFSLHPQS